MSQVIMNACSDWLHLILLIPSIPLYITVVFLTHFWCLVVVIRKYANVKVLFSTPTYPHIHRLTVVDV